MTEVEIIEANRENLEKAYYELSTICLREEGFDLEGEKHKVLAELETALVGLGILEADEEPEEEEDPDDDRNSAENWDEWAADQRYDEYRDRVLMGYEN